MQIFLFVALIIAILAVAFAFQNNDPATISFAIWKFHGSLALILMVTLAAGALISFLVSLPTNVKTRWTVRTQRKKLVELENRLAEFKGKLEEATRELEEVARGKEKEVEVKVEENPETPQTDAAGEEPEI